MKRRELLQGAAAFGVLAAMPFTAAGRWFGSPRQGAAPAGDKGSRPDGPRPLTPPAEDSIPVAFLLSAGAVVIDFCGPWEVFQDVSLPGRQENAFRLYTVAETTQPIPASGGLTIVPDYTLAAAPAPKVIVIPAQSGRSAAMLDWLRAASRNADVTMSVCTGAFLLAATGLLAGKSATTHHSSYRTFAMEFPDIHLRRGARFVEEGNLASSGGLSSGIDLALRVVERYFGRAAAAHTADQMEYQGQGWLNPQSNAVYAQARASTDAHPMCPVCEMDVDRATAPKSVYKGKTYYFCSPDHQARFAAAPERYLVA
ncbi:MAG TPA: DJ-1/PfpI family protein [Thermoanaerobaculia bacterium]|jgi:putative intracellular protease/amidase/YHS domain-containing protein|nr:DJ-1/PfpI family protein [Thermoanaerobaculia bacterium]